MSRRALVNQLAAAGMWDHITAEARKAAVRSVRDGGWPLATIERDGWRADRGAGIFLAEIAPTLAPLGVTLDVASVAAQAEPLGVVNALLEQSGTPLRVAVFCSPAGELIAHLLPIAVIDVLASSDEIPPAERPVTR